MTDYQAVRKRNPDGTISIGYLNYGIPCVHTELTCPKARKATRLQLIHKELEYAEAAITLFLRRINYEEGEVRTIQTDDEEVLFLRSLYVASIVTYAKCFTSPGRNRSSLDRRQVFKGNKANYLAFHEWIIEEQRNSFIAHPSDSDHEQASTYMLFRAFDANVGWFHITPHVATVMVPDPSVMDSFLYVVRYVKKWVKNAVDRCVRSIDRDRQTVLNLRSKAVYSHIEKMPAPPPAIYPWLEASEEPDQGE